MQWHHHSTQTNIIGCTIPYAVLSTHTLLHYHSTTQLTSAALGIVGGWCWCCIHQPQAQAQPQRLHLHPPTLSSSSLVLCVVLVAGSLTLGIGCVGGGWRRRWLSCLLLLDWLVVMFGANCYVDMKDMIVGGKMMNGRYMWMYQLSGWGWSSSSWSVLMDHAAPEVHVRAVLYFTVFASATAGRTSTVHYKYWWMILVALQQVSFWILLLLLGALSRGPRPSCAFINFEILLRKDRWY